MAEKLDVREIHHPFLTIDHVCFFLQKSYWQVRELIVSLHLNPAKTATGSDFVPSRRPVFRALDIEPLLDESSRDVFVRWQRGELVVPPLTSNRMPLSLADAVPANSSR